MKRWFLVSLLLPQASFAFTPPEFCPKSDEGALVYPVCNDQSEKLAQAKERAGSAGKLLLVVFGGTWCPWSRAFHSDLLTRFSAATADFEVVELPISTLDASGKVARVPSGSESVAGLLRELGIEARGLKIKLPGLIVLDPSHPAHGEFEQRKYLLNDPDRANSYTEESLRAFLQEARQRIRPAP